MAPCSFESAGTDYQVNWDHAPGARGPQLTPQ